MDDGNAARTCLVGSRIGLRGRVRVLGRCKHRSIQSTESVSVEVDIDEASRRGSECWRVLRWFGVL